MLPLATVASPIGCELDSLRVALHWTALFARRLARVKRAGSKRGAPISKMASRKMRFML